MKRETLWDVSDRGMDIMLWCGAPCILQLLVTCPLGLFVHEVFLLVGIFAAVAGVFAFLFGLVVYNLFGWLAARKSK